MLEGLIQSFNLVIATDLARVLFSRATELEQKLAVFQLRIDAIQALSSESRLMIEREFIKEICDSANKHIQWLLECDADEACGLIDSFANSCDDLFLVPALLDAIREINSQMRSQQESLSHTLHLLRNNSWYAPLIVQEDIRINVCSLERESWTVYRRSDVDRINQMVGDIVGSALSGSFAAIQNSSGLRNFLAGQNGELSFSAQPISTAADALLSLGDASRLLNPVTLGVRLLIDLSEQDIDRFSKNGLFLYSGGGELPYSLYRQAKATRIEFRDLWSTDPHTRVGCLVRNIGRIGQIVSDFVEFAQFS